MKYTNKNGLHRQLVESVLTVVVVLSLFVTNLFPQAVSAVSWPTAGIEAISNFFTGNEPVITTEQVIFPEIQDFEPRRTVWMTMTAYSSDVEQTDSTPCIPADGTYNLCEHYEEYGEQDTIATNFLPLGTKVKFPELYGDKVFTVRDRMNQRYGYGRGDIWMPSRTEAKVFGVKRVVMEIYYR